ncbi:MAG: cytochrome-c peroxidase, partial [Burkholderiales bacterium]
MTSPRHRSKLAASRLAFAAACAALSWASLAGESVSEAAPFTDGEIKIILSHGPWPAPVAYDPSNRVSGRPEAVVLGMRLFFDRRLSGKGTVSCATCHVPERNWTDNLRHSAGVAEMDRNTPTLMNLLGAPWYGWDGVSDSLWSQSLRPIVDARELAATPQHVARLVREDEELSCRYRRAFGVAPSERDDDAVFVDAGKALAAFQETLMSGPTPFDEFRDDLARGKRPSSWSYSEPARRGLRIFIGKGGCTACHAGPNFTGGEFFSTGLSRPAQSGKPAPG